jgi:hypothetical protein
MDWWKAISTILGLLTAVAMLANFVIGLQLRTSIAEIKTLIAEKQGELKDWTDQHFVRKAGSP